MSLIKKKKDLFKKLNDVLQKNPDKFINWLKNVPINYADGKIPSLFNTSKIQIETSTPDGIYNLTLLWIIENKDNLKQYRILINDLPSSNFIKIEDIFKSMDIPGERAATQKKNLDIDDALKKWKENPNINPYDDSNIKISIVPTSMYGLLYEKFCKHLSINKESPIQPITFEKEIRDKLPNNHIYAFKDIDYIENIKSLYPNEEWINFLDGKKNIFYKNEKVKDVIGSTVYDFLFMHFFLIKNKKNFDKNVVIDNIDKQLFLYETILAQIKHIKALDLNCYEIFESMVYVGTDRTESDNFKLIKLNKNKGSTMWPYEIPPLLKLFVEYINEITYYILPISNLNKIIFIDYFLYGEKKPQTTKEIYNLMVESIEYNIYRIKTIINIIFSSLYIKSGDGVSERINIKEFFNILFFNISECIYEINYWNQKKQNYEAHENKLITINNILAYTRAHQGGWGSRKIDEYKFKMFFVSAIFDIKILHEESSDTNNTKYEPIKDPYDNLPDPPQIPKTVIINQELQRYKMTSHIVGKNSKEEKELKELEKKQSNYKKELKEYDKKLKEYNDKYLDKKLSPYFSVKLSRAKSVINNKNSLRLNYSPLKVSAKSLTKFKSSKNKALLSKFEKEPYSRTYKKNKEEEKRQEIEIEEWREREWAQGGGTGKTLSKSDLKLKLALEADNPKFKKYAKSLSPSEKSPRQKYIGCDLNDNDPITQEAFSNMHFKKIKYLSKIKTILPNGKIITNCYDTVALYNYILSCNNTGEPPINHAQGREPFNLLQLDEVYKKIKYFTKKPTLQRNIDTSRKIFLKTFYQEPLDDLHGFPYYIIFADIIIGSASFPISRDNYYYWQDGMFRIIKAPIISRDDILFEDTSDNTALLIERGVENGSLLKINKYPYWHTEGHNFMPNTYNLTAVPSFSWSSYDNFDRLKERTHVLNNRISRLI